MSYAKYSQKVFFASDSNALPPAPFIRCAELPPIDHGSPQSSPFSSGLPTPPWTPESPGYNHLSPPPVQFGISATVAQISIDIAWDPTLNSQSMQPATTPSIPFFYLVSRALNLSILVQAKDQHAVTILDIHKALHEHFYRKLKRSDALPCSPQQVNACFEQRMRYPKSRTNNDPHACRIDTLCGRTSVRFIRLVAGNNGMEMELEFH